MNTTTTHKRNCTIVCGPQASGKTTYIDNLIKKKNFAPSEVFTICPGSETNIVEGLKEVSLNPEIKLIRVEEVTDLTCVMLLALTAKGYSTLTGKVYEIIIETQLPSSSFNFVPYSTAVEMERKAR